MTLKTGVTMLQIQLCITEINYIKNIYTYIYIYYYYELYFSPNNISVLWYFLLNKCSLGEHMKLSKTFKNLTDHKYMNVVYDHATKLAIQIFKKSPQKYEGMSEF